MIKVPAKTVKDDTGALVIVPGGDITGPKVIAVVCDGSTFFVYQAGDKIADPGFEFPVTLDAAKVAEITGDLTLKADQAKDVIAVDADPVPVADPAPDIQP